MSRRKSLCLSSLTVEIQCLRICAYTYLIGHCSTVPYWNGKSWARFNFFCRTTLRVFAGSLCVGRANWVFPFQWMRVATFLHAVLLSVWTWLYITCLGMSLAVLLPFTDWFIALVQSFIQQSTNCCDTMVRLSVYHFHTFDFDWITLRYSWSDTKKKTKFPPFLTNNLFSSSGREMSQDFPLKLLTCKHQAPSIAP